MQQRQNRMRELRACNSFASSNKKKTDIHSLPEEMIIYILILLPADVLYHSTRFVCRKWFNIVDSPMFVAEHLLHYRSAFLSQPSVFHQGTCLAVFGESNANVAELSLPVKNEVCASCDGLAVVRVNGKFYVANLLTKQTIALPWVNNYHLHRPRRRSMSLIRGSGMGDYRAVFSYLSGDDRNLQCIYITVGKDDAWRPISCGDLADLYRVRTDAAVKTVGVGGIVYWVVDSRSPIFALGNDMETFHQLSNPRLNYGVCQCAYIGGRKTLSLVVSFEKELVLDVWFVSRSGSCFEWRKEKRIDLCARSPELTWPSFMDPLYGLAWVNNDEAVVLKDSVGCFVYHNVKTGKTFKFGRKSIGCRGYFADFRYSLLRLT